MRNFGTILLLIVVLFVLITSVAAASMPPSDIRYSAHEPVQVREFADGTGAVLAEIPAGVEYPVIVYNWSPATASNAWACIEYAVNRPCAYAPVQINGRIYATVKYHVGVFYPTGWGVISPN